jgi:hypothetical protein
VKIPAVCRSSRAAVTLQASGDRGSPGEDLDAVDEQRLPRPVSRRQDPTGGEPNRASLGLIVKNFEATALQQKSLRSQFIRKEASAKAQ